MAERQDVKTGRTLISSQRRVLSWLYRYTLPIPGRSERKITPTLSVLFPSPPSKQDVPVYPSTATTVSHLSNHKYCSTVPHPRELLEQQREGKSSAGRPEWWTFPTADPQTNKQTHIHTHAHKFVGSERQEGSDHLCRLGFSLVYQWQNEQQRIQWCANDKATIWHIHQLIKLTLNQEVR